MEPENAVQQWSPAQPQIQPCELPTAAKPLADRGAEYTL